MSLGLLQLQIIVQDHRPDHYMFYSVTIDLKLQFTNFVTLSLLGHYVFFSGFEEKKCKI